tara:strand:+ start:55492 stop:58680 length:3189 start_codon:yes stop_codon:yes gene_type:complete
MGPHLPHAIENIDTEPPIERIINGTPTTQFPSVGIVGESFGGYCSGTLIASQYVLTAAHCAEGVGDTAGRVQFGPTTYSTSEVIIHPNYDESNFGTDIANDIAIYKLTSPVVGITPSEIYRQTPTVGSTLTLVGYGYGGTGDSGADGVFGTKRVGTTPIDAVSSTLVYWDFDNNTESNTAPGDSGGPAFIQSGGEYLVAGVTSGGTLEDAGLGDESFDTRVDVYQNWIDGILNPVATTNYVDYTSAGSTYTQSFDSLASSGTSSSLPSGWHLYETDTNADSTYAASDGTPNSGNTYSFGDSGSSERALGSLRSGSLEPIIGAAIRNSTGANLSSMTIGFHGEQWRRGTSGRSDHLDFQYSLNASGLSDGTWIDVDALDFESPTTSGAIGALDGNAPGNGSDLSATIGGLNIPNGSTFWIRWVDANASGADDGLAIDSFVFTSGGGTATNTAPTVTGIDNQTTPFQTATGAIAFTIGDAETSPASLTVTATSSNTSLVPNASISLGGSGASRTMTLTPTAGQSGDSTITVNVSDGELTTSTSFLLTVNPATPTSNENLRIVSYNISAASGNGTPRSDFETVLQAIGTEIVNGVSRQVDVFALQEVLSQATTSTIIASSLNNTYGTTAYVAGTLNGGTSGSGTQGVVYNSETVQLVGEGLVGTVSASGAPRQTIRHHFRPVGTSGESDFYIYNSHLKASTGDEGRRFIDVQAIRNDADSLGQGAHVIYAGDFNMFTSNEPGYQEFLSSGNGQAFDPINRPGNWRNNSSFRDIFTQAPSATVQPGLGLDGGGMDDRLDFQLISGELQDGAGMDYRTGSYHTFGVNGSVALNGSIDDASNTALPELGNRLTVLSLLRTVSDHLPVVADFIVPVSTEDAPEIAGVVIDDGTQQRSMIRSLSITFDGIVNTPASAFTLTNLGKQDNPSTTEVTNLIIEREVVGMQTIATITFGSGPGVVDRASGNSLIDGEYRLDIDGSQIVTTGGGTSMESDYVLGDDVADDFFRLYGDANGDGLTNFTDFASSFLPSFASSIGSPNFESFLDADGDDHVNFSDFASSFLPNFATGR